MEITSGHAPDLPIAKLLCPAGGVASLKPARPRQMSWSELERLVEQAEGDAALRRALMHCRSRSELVLASRRLGFGIDEHDLRIAWQLHQRPSADAKHPDGGPSACRVDRCG